MRIELTRPADTAQVFLAAATQFTRAAQALRIDPKQPTDPASAAAQALEAARAGIALLEPIADGEPNSADAGRAIDAITSALMGSQLLRAPLGDSSTSRRFREVRELYAAAALACTD